MKKIVAVLICSLLVWCCKAQSTITNESGIDTLQVFRNGNRYFEVGYDLKHVLKLKEVKAIKDSSITVSIALTYNTASGSMLKIYNPFAEQLVYKAELYAYKKKEYLETSTVPVYPKLQSFETWPYKIDEVRLSGFILIKAK